MFSWSSLYKVMSFSLFRHPTSWELPRRLLYCIYCTVPAGRQRARPGLAWREGGGPDLSARMTTLGLVDSASWGTPC